MKRRDFGKQIAAAGLTSAVLGTHRVLADDRQIHVGMLLYPQLTLLDPIGPQTVLSAHAKIHLIWKTRDMIVTHEDGVWPDKTVLIAEMHESAANVSISKSGRVQTAKVLAVEAEVKDATKGGWAFYGFENGAQSGTLFPKSAAFYSCHKEHASTDNTFVQFYPTLIETAKRHGTHKERQP